MKTIILFFLTVQFYYLFNNRYLYYMLQKVMKLVQDHQENPESHRIILVNASSMIFVAYMIADLLFLFFCIWLLFTEAYWQQGGMLFILTSLETYAFHTKVAYTYDEDQNGFIYPKAWVRCLFSGFTIYILTKLYLSF